LSLQFTTHDEEEKVTINTILKYLAFNTLLRSFMREYTRFGAGYIRLGAGKEGGE
jgi:hypothetical protein